MIHKRYNNYLKITCGDSMLNVISAYSRQNAINDGVLVDVTTMSKELGFKFSVAVTATVWNKRIFWSDEDTHLQTYQDTNGRLWDVLFMLRFGITKNCDKNYLKYKLYVIPRNGKSTKAKLTELKSVMSAGDNGEPVITIMLPNED